LTFFSRPNLGLKIFPFELFSTDSNYLNYKYSLTRHLFSDSICRVRFASARSRPLNHRQGTISFHFLLSPNCKPPTANPFRFILFRTLCTNQTHKKRRISPVFNLLRTLAKTMAGWGYIKSKARRGFHSFPLSLAPGDSRKGCTLSSLFCRPPQLIFLFLSSLRTLYKNTRGVPSTRISMHRTLFQCPSRRSFTTSALSENPLSSLAGPP
jgi:hypothetical protein